MIASPVRRRVVIGALLLLAALAATRLRLAHMPTLRHPELRVWLQLPGDHEPSLLTREHVVPIESAIRALGRDVTSMSGEVNARGTRLRVRLTPGTDPERASAHLLASLAAHRATLPATSRLEIWPAASGGAAAVVALTGDGRHQACRDVADDLRGLAAVREIRVHGCPDDQITVEIDPSLPPATAAAVRPAIEGAFAAPLLGSWREGNHRAAVVAGGRRELDDVVVAAAGAALPLASLARVERGARPLTSAARVDGAAAVLLSVEREHGSDLLAFDRALRRQLRHLESDPTIAATVPWSTAEPVARMLRRQVVGLLLASLLGAAIVTALSGRRALLRGVTTPWLLLAGALLPLGLVDAEINVVTGPAVAVALAAACPLALLRTERARVAAAAATLAGAAALAPIAVALSTGRLAETLTEPARAFALAAGGAALMAALLGPLPAGRGRADPIARRGLAAALHEPAAAILLATAIAYFALAGFGAALDPRASALAADPSRLTIQLSLPEGATLADTDARLVDAEARVDGIDAVTERWSWASAGSATIVLRVAPDHRRGGRRRSLETLLGYRLDGVAAAVVIGAAATRGDSFRFDGELEERPETDEDATRYRVLLESPEVDSLVRAYGRLGDALRGTVVRPEWGSPTVRLHLEPRRDRAEAAPALAQALAARSVPPAAVPLPGVDDRTIRIDEAWTPADDVVPLRAELLASVVEIDGAETDLGRLVGAVHERVVYPAVKRQSGRFVLPVSIALWGWRAEDRRETRWKVDTILADLALPTDVDLERPDLGRWQWTRARLRLWALMGLLPAVLFAASAVRLDSIAGGLGVAATATLGLAAAAPLVAAGGGLEVPTLIALAAALCAGAALPATLLAHIAASPAGAAIAVCRAVRRQQPALLTGAVVALGLLVAPTVGADLATDPWVAPQRVAGACLAAIALASATALPPLALVGRNWKRRDAAASERRRRPPAWRDDRATTLAVHSLGKRYRGDVWALRDVAFELEPGIIGLVGPNGAGKTTLLRCLAGLLEPSRGAVAYRGVAVEPANLSAYRRHIGFLPQEFNAYPDLTGAEFLDYWGYELGLEHRTERRAACERVLAEVDLVDAAGKRVRDYSGGMRQRIGVARALLTEPELLIVDEPTTGLDVAARNRLRDTLLRVARERVVLLSTHIASDVEATAGRLLLLDRGRLRFDGAPSELIARARGRVFEALVDDQELRDFTRRYNVTRRVRVLDGIRVRAVATVGEAVAGNAVEPTLEEAYVSALDLDARRRTSALGFLDRSEERS